MASMKPLFTITVLLVVGVYLYKTINEGPVRPHAAQGAGDQTTSIPPLAAAGGAATLAQDSATPAWPANAPNAGPAAPVLPPAVTPVDGKAAPAAAPPSTAAAADPAKPTLPEVPPIPELPELPKTSDVAAAAVPITPPAAATVSPAAPATPAAPALTPAMPAPVTPPEQVPPAANATVVPPPAAPAPTAAPAVPAMPSAAAAAPPASPPLTPIPPAAAQSNASVTPAQSPAATPADDRYGQSTNPAPPVAPPAAPAPGAPPTASIPPASNPPITPVPTAPTASGAAPAATFAASWPAIQAALDKNDLKQAHQLLSKWHGDETLSPADAQKVETLLGQLAGTVIYSNEHRLEPARVVKQGESLESIAKEYNVPWQLLAKINSIAAPEQLRPGQELKVVRGPFSAVVDLHRNELTLEVDGRYAGTFNVTVPPGSPVVEGQWAVDQKVAGQPNAVAPVAYTTPPATADRAIVLRSAAAVQPGGPTLAITSGHSATPPSPGAVAIQVAPQDAEDLSDILSIGSRVIVRK